ERGFRKRLKQLTFVCIDKDAYSSRTSVIRSCQLMRRINKLCSNFVAYLPFAWREYEPDLVNRQSIHRLDRIRVLQSAYFDPDLLVHRCFSVPNSSLTAAPTSGWRMKCSPINNPCAPTDCK